MDQTKSIKSRNTNAEENTNFHAIQYLPTASDIYGTKPQK
jgi:hypothetical protein